jgi:hypothetical protein
MKESELKKKLCERNRNAQDVLSNETKLKFGQELNEFYELNYSNINSKKEEKL